MFIKRSKILFWLVVLVTDAHAVYTPTAPLDINFKGNLIQNACSIKAGDENLQVAMRAHTDKDLYEKPRTSATTFQINLEECDPAIASSVRITFTGGPSEKLPGYLAVTGAESDMGFAIGIETPAGKLLKLNDSESVHELTLQSGSNSIALQAFLKAEPEAITDKSVRLGEYSATAMFMLEYL
ncbi:fimbrial protein [Pseudescherichia vulneris]